MTEKKLVGIVKLHGLIAGTISTYAGVTFLSGGQSELEATANLNAMNKVNGMLTPSSFYKFFLKLFIEIIQFFATFIQIHYTGYPIKKPHPEKLFR